MEWFKCRGDDFMLLFGDYPWSREKPAPVKFMKMMAAAICSTGIQRDWPERRLASAWCVSRRVVDEVKASIGWSLAPDWDDISMPGSKMDPKRDHRRDHATTENQPLNLQIATNLDPKRDQTVTTRARARFSEEGELDQILEQPPNPPLIPPPPPPTGVETPPFGGMGRDGSRVVEQLRESESAAADTPPPQVAPPEVSPDVFLGGPNLPPVAPPEPMIWHGDIPHAIPPACVPHRVEITPNEANDAWNEFWERHGRPRGVKRRGLLEPVKVSGVLESKTEFMACLDAYWSRVYVSDDHFDASTSCPSWSGFLAEYAALARWVADPQPGERGPRCGRSYRNTAKPRTREDPMRGIRFNSMETGYQPTKSHLYGKGDPLYKDP